MPFKFGLDVLLKRPEVDAARVAMVGLSYGEYCRSINHMKSGPTQNRLLELCDRLKYAEESGDGMLDTL